MINREQNVATALRLIEVAESEDPKAKILEMVGNLDDIQVLGSRVLVGTFVAPRKTKGGIILTDQTIDEDRWQGKVGLVLKLGPAAFKYDGGYAYEGPKPECGQWVEYRPADTAEVGIRGVACRYIESQSIRGIIADPSIIY